MKAQKLMDTARALVADDKGLLAMDESTPTCDKRFARLGIPQTEEARRARYAALCQEAGLVPVVEPEVLMDGEHTLERCGEVTEEVLRTVFNQLYTQGVTLEGMILKPNMVLPGLTCPKQEAVDEVADATVRCLLRAVPAAVPGIAFLSGGQSSELASARLNAMNARFKSRLPCALAFSFARAIQQPALEIWHGEDANILAAQQALYHRASCNRSARRGEYTEKMERK